MKITNIPDTLNANHSNAAEDLKNVLAQDAIPEEHAEMSALERLKARQAEFNRRQQERHADEQRQLNESANRLLQDTDLSHVDQAQVDSLAQSHIQANSLSQAQANSLSQVQPQSQANSLSQAQVNSLSQAQVNSLSQPQSQVNSLSQTQAQANSLSQAQVNSLSQTSTSHSVSAEPIYSTNEHLVHGNLTDNSAITESAHDATEELGQTRAFTPIGDYVAPSLTNNLGETAVYNIPLANNPTQPTDSPTQPIDNPTKPVRSDRSTRSTKPVRGDRSTKPVRGGVLKKVFSVFPKRVEREAYLEDTSDAYSLSKSLRKIGWAMLLCLFGLLTVMACTSYLMDHAPKGKVTQGATSSQVTKSQATKPSKKLSPMEQVKQNLTETAKATGIDFKIATSDIGGGYILGTTTYNPNDSTKQYVDDSITAPETPQEPVKDETASKIEQALKSTGQTINDTIKVKKAKNVSMKTYKVAEGQYHTILLYKGKPFAYVSSDANLNMVNHVTTYYVSDVAA